MATYSVNNIKIDNGLFFTPGPTAGNVLSINSDGSTTWISPQSGPSGSAGTSGSSGTSGVNGLIGSNGVSGSSGTSGSSGSSGTSGSSGSSGTSGVNGSSGTSGQNGTSGTSSSATSLTTFTTLTTSSLIKATASTAYMIGLGLTGSFGNAFIFTPASVGVINVLLKSSTNTSVSNEIDYELRYGTGTAPSAGTVASGTSVDNLRLRNTTINVKNNELVLSSIISGLTTGITYWFDVSAKSASTCDLILNDVRINLFELR